MYNRQGEKLGSVHNFMVDKRSGKAEYAVMSFGGFLGMGDSYHPLPWNMLTYDTSHGGYVVDLDKRVLQEAPSYKAGQEPRYDAPMVNRSTDTTAFPTRPTCKSCRGRRATAVLSFSWRRICRREIS